MRGAEPLEELRIRVRDIGEGRYLVIANGPTSAADVIRWRPRDFAGELDELFDEAFGDRSRSGRKPLEARLTDLGRDLFSALFPSAVRDCLEESIRVSSDDECRLRVRFDLPPELSSLPVEIVAPPRGDAIGLPLARAGARSVVRSVHGTIRPRLPKPGEGWQALSVLVIAASPRGYAPICADDELGTLRNELDEPLSRDGVTIEVFGEPSGGDRASFEAIQRWMGRRRGPTAVLLIAHGEIRDGVAHVVLEANDRSPQLVPSPDFAALVGAPRHVRLAVLNVCLGARILDREPLSGVAHALIGNGVPAVVGMSTMESDAAGTCISAPLFKAIADNRSVDEAVLAARLRLSQAASDTRIEWCSPVLCVAEGLLRGRLFKVPNPEPDDDPLAEGEEAARRLGTNPAPAHYEPAAYYRRAIGQWARVAGHAREGRGLAGDEADRTRFRRIEREAAVELAMGHIDALSVGLANDTPDLALQAPPLRDPLDPIVACLAAEMELREGYRAARRAVETGNWSEALEHYDKILEGTPDDPVAVAGGEVARLELELARLSREGRMAMDDEDWSTASKRFGAILDLRPDGNQDAAKSRLYAEGRMAEAEESWEAAITSFAMIGEPGLGDERDRITYGRGRLAERDERWADAADLYAELDGRPHGSDVAIRRWFAEGRAGEEAGDWMRAASAYAKLGEDDHAERSARLAYTHGRAAADQGDWAQALEALGPLSDGHRDVKPWRAYAKARRAEQAGDWDDAQRALSSLDESFADDDVGRLRIYCQARLAEACEDWAEATAAYALLGDQERDVFVRRRYVTARMAEEREDWQSAAEGYGALAPEYEDANARRSYSSGRRAEEAGDWQAAIQAFEAALEHLDSAARLRRAQSWRATHLGQWQEVLTLLSDPPAEIDENPLEPYALGRIAEDEESWAAARSAYRTCGQFLDAMGRLAYVDGRQSEELGNLSSALAHYGAAGDLQVAQQRAVRVSALRAALPWADGLAGAGLVEDPIAGRHEPSPYSLLRWAGITPSSTASELLNASFDLMRNERWAPETRVAWDQLRSLHNRLRHDACLYRLADGPSLAQQLLALEPGQSSSLLRRLSDRLPTDAPLLSLLAGDRDAAIAAWEERLHNDLTDDESCRALAIAYTWRAVDLEHHDRPTDAEAVWNRAFAHWGRLLGADWTGWRRERASLYQHAISPTDIDRARRGVPEQLLARLAALSARAPASEAGDKARFGRLQLHLEAELLATRALAAAGGIRPGGNQGATVSFGPLFLASHSELVDDIADLAIRLEDDERLEPDALRLRAAFSEMSLPLVLLDQNRPDRALEALHGRHLRTLAQLPEGCQHGGLSAAEPEACEECQTFRDRNPGYLRFDHRHTRMLQDAIEIAGRALQSLAQSALAEGHPQEALNRWREAIDVAANVGTQVRARRATIPAVQGRADALSREKGSARGERLSEAIELVTAARALVGKADQGELAATHAELLTARGVWLGYWCHPFQEPDLARAAADLRAALELNPESVDTRDNLARALVFGTTSTSHDDHPGRQLRWLGEALQTLHDGLLTSGHSQLQAMLLEAVGQLERWCLDELSDDQLRDRIRRPSTAPDSDVAAGSGRAREQARQARLEFQDDPVGSILTFVAAWRSDPTDAQVRGELSDAVRRLSKHSEWDEPC